MQNEGKFLRGSVRTGIKEDKSSNGRVWAARFHHVTDRSRLARVLKLMNRLFLYFIISFSGRGKPRILNKRIRGHDSTAYCMKVSESYIFV
jgi:hypothetical protein